MKLKYLLPTMLLTILVFNSCKKDNGDEKEEEWLRFDEPGLKYDGGTYMIEDGRVWDYKFNRYSSHYTRAFFLLNGNSFDPGGNYDLGSGDPPISLFYFLSVPLNTNLFAGDFEFLEIGDEWITEGLPADVRDKKVFMFAVVGFDADGDKKITAEEMIRVTGGVISANGSAHGYDLQLENGKTLKGSIYASMTEQLPPS